MVWGFGSRRQSTRRTGEVVVWKSSWVWQCSEVDGSIGVSKRTVPTHSLSNLGLGLSLERKGGDPDGGDQHCEVVKGEHNYDK